MALYNLVSKNELANLKYRPTNQQVYDAIGRNAGSSSGDNYITKKAKSLENAFGTTGAVIAAGVHNMETNRHIDNMQKQQKEDWDKLYQKYGFKSRDDYFEQLENSFDENDNETDETRRLLNIPGLNEEEQAMASRNNQAWDENGKRLRDWAENNYVSKKIGQDRGKFLGSAMNTLSTGFDVLSMAAVFLTVP